MLKIAATLCLFVSSLLIGNSALAANDPTLHQVYAAIQAGRLPEAQHMMDTVLHDHPNSAKAHYVEAQIMVREGRFVEAEGELDRAEHLKPGLPFVKPEAVQALKHRIDVREEDSTPARDGFPWGMVLLGLASIVIITLVVRAMSRRNTSVYPGGPRPGMQPMYGNRPYGPTSGPMSGGGMGSSILGGLATGAAVGAGMVAGEELAHHFTDGTANAAPMDDSSGTPADFGGNDFGITDDGTSWDDGSSGFTDFGGGDDWN